MPAEEEGAIDVHLDELLAARAMTLSELSERVGVTIVNLSILKNGRARAVRFSTLTKLCEVLTASPATCCPGARKKAEPQPRSRRPRGVGRKPAGFSAAPARVEHRLAVGLLDGDPAQRAVHDR